jgi:hypothetical protein
VYDILAANTQLLVRRRISTFNDLRTDDLGDIDVLCAERAKRTLWVVECKSLAMARTPYEMAMHLQELTVGDGKHPDGERKLGSCDDRIFYVHALTLS